MGISKLLVTGAHTHFNWASVSYYFCADTVPAYRLDFMIQAILTSRLILPLNIM